MDESVDIKPKVLSRDMIRSLMRRKDERNIKLSGTLQLLQCARDGSVMVLSDGFCQVQAAVIKSIRENVKVFKLRDFDVLYVSLILHNGTTVAVIAFRKVYDSVRCLIGHPVDFTAYQASGFANEDGDNFIPLVSHQSTSSTCTKKRRPDWEPGPWTKTKVRDVGLGKAGLWLTARVTKKSPKRAYSAEQRQGTLFTVVLVDETGEIQATFFTDATAKWYDSLANGKMYHFRGVEVRKKGLYNTTDHPVELYVSTKCLIEDAEDDAAVQAEEFRFVRIADLKAREPMSNCDLVGLVVGVGKPEVVQVKKAELKTKQTLRMRDDSGFEVEVNLWGSIPDADALQPGVVAILIDLTVSEFKGRMLNSKASTRIFRDLPRDCDRCQRVLAFAAQASLDLDAPASLSVKKPGPVTLYSVEQARRLLGRSLGSSVHTFCSVRAFLTGFSSNFCYDKCPNDSCFKKVVPDPERPNFCECVNCGPIYKNPVSRYIGHVRITDHTATLFANFATDPIGQALYGRGIEEMKRLCADSEEEYLRLTEPRLGKLMVFRLFAKQELAEAGPKTKYHLVNVHDDDLPERCLYTLECLRHTCLLYKPNK